MFIDQKIKENTMKTTVSFGMKSATSLMAKIVFSMAFVLGTLAADIQIANAQNNGNGEDETWSISGGLAGYDDGFGRVQVGFGGGIQLRGSTSDNWSVGVAGAVSGGAGVIRLQGRIGG